MFPGSSRRTFLHLLLGGAGVLALPQRSLAAQAQSGSTAAAPLAPTAPATPSAASADKGVDARVPLTTTRLAPEILLIAGVPGNVVVVTGPDGATLINGGSAERAAELLHAVSAATNGRPVRTLFNTDWHPEHTGSNELLAAAGATIVAHTRTKEYLGTETHVDWQERTYKPRPRQAWPTKTFYTSGQMTVGAEALEYGYLGQAHTDGDIYVYCKTSNVLVVGDELAVGRYPIADYTTGGWIGGMATATKTLIDLSNAETRVIPGRGPVQTRADLQAQFEMLSALRDRLGKMMRQGMGADDMLAAGATKEFDARWGDPSLFVSTAYRGLWLHAREMGGVV